MAKLRRAALESLVSDDDVPRVQQLRDELLVTDEHLWRNEFRAWRNVFPPRQHDVPIPDDGETLQRYWQRTRLVRLDAKFSDSDAAALLLRFVDREHRLCSELKVIATNKQDPDASPITVNDLLSNGGEYAEYRLADASKAAKDDATMTFVLNNIKPLHTPSLANMSSQTTAPSLLTNTQTAAAVYNVSRAASSTSHAQTPSRGVIPSRPSSKNASEPKVSPFAAEAKRYNIRSTAKKRRHNNNNDDEDDDDYKDDEESDNKSPPLKRAKSTDKSKSSSRRAAKTDDDSTDGDKDVDDKQAAQAQQADRLAIMADAATNKADRCEFCSKLHGVINVRSPSGRVLCLGSIRLPQVGRASTFGKAVATNGEVTHVNLYPVGYVAEVEMGGLWFRCSVGVSDDDEDKPQFRVECAGVKCDADTMSAAWTQMMKAKSRSGAVSGPKYFLINDPTVARAIYELPNAKTLWDRLKGPSGGPARVEADSQ